MNRFKFRVWNPEENKLMYFTLGEPTFPDRYLHQHSHPVQQFTGKLDIENTEIWEGDLVELVYAQQTDSETGEKLGPPDSFGLYEIVYDPYQASYQLKTQKQNWMRHYSKKGETLPMPLGICRVVGNTYQTPEPIP